ncbi:hypothetical protein PROFUN_12507 [Planoprotostelium fungivorum]|uniref:Uncharacterized protein n=1 Tax=Planoprotostelium fungivorum TaxID=1890364 RepID=A0A2P6N799_9EUKA|nr:hypothetical protein PROFUN_12507 [Planoprotostelium fungivorum]
MARQDQYKTSNFLSRQIQKLQDKTETQIFMSLQIVMHGHQPEKPNQMPKKLLKIELSVHARDNMKDSYQQNELFPPEQPMNQMEENL